MFIEKLYKHNKFLCAGFLSFAALQLFINIKWGITAAPFLHYGMYSGYLARPSTLTIWNIQVDKKKINLLDYSPKVADCITEPLRVYDQQVESNHLYYTHIQRFLAPWPRLDSNNFISRLSKHDFGKWYKQNLSKIIGRDVVNLKVFKNEYLVNGSNLVLKKESLFVYDNK